MKIGVFLSSEKFPAEAELIFIQLLTADGHEK
jgi:hypothetical protein